MKEALLLHQYLCQAGMVCAQNADKHKYKITEKKCRKNHEIKILTNHQKFFHCTAQINYFINQTLPSPHLVSK